MLCSMQLLHTREPAGRSLMLSIPSTVVLCCTPQLCCVALGMLYRKYQYKALISML